MADDELVIAIVAKQSRDGPRRTPPRSPLRSSGPRRRHNESGRADPSAPCYIRCSHCGGAASSNSTWFSGTSSQIARYSATSEPSVA